MNSSLRILNVNKSLVSAKEKSVLISTNNTEEDFYSYPFYYDISTNCYIL